MQEYIYDSSQIQVAARHVTLGTCDCFIHRGPATALLWELPSEDRRFFEKSAIPIVEELPDASRAFSLGESNYGGPPEVLS